jgi:hypothetical protein
VQTNRLWARPNKDSEHAGFEYTSRSSSPAQPTPCNKVRSTSNPSPRAMRTAWSNPLLYVIAEHGQTVDRLSRYVSVSLDQLETGDVTPLTGKHWQYRYCRLYMSDSNDIDSRGMAGYGSVDSREIEGLEHGRFVSCQARSDIVDPNHR